MKRRTLFIQIGVVAGYALILGRALFLMLQDNEKLEKIAFQQYRTLLQEEAGRSRILDRRGRELAMDKPVFSLWADPAQVKNPRETAGILSRHLGMSQRELVQKLKGHRRFVWLRRWLDAQTVEKLPPLEGIDAVRENKRYYPHGSLAGHLLGAVGLDARALGGVELAYDRYLMRTPPAETYMKDAKGRLYLASTRRASPHPKGDLYLTIDKNLQFMLEESLSRAVARHRAKGGQAILIDPATGAVLGLAGEPSFNPNHFHVASPERWRSRAVTDVFEPGSTLKVVFLAGALESGLLSLNEKMDCEQGRFELPGGKAIHDTKPHGKLTPREIIQVSSNIGAYKIAQRLGREGMWEWMRAFGLGQKTGIDFPSEAAGLLRSYKEWSPIEEATIAFGQGVGATALQIASLYAALANDGVQMKPHLVEKVVSSEGDLLYQARPGALRRSVSPATSRQVRKILQSVVEEGGTAPEAFLAAYPAAGKTGTSQKSKGGVGYLPGKYVATFVGFAPVEKPRLVLLVLLDEPGGEEYYGGKIAAPLFRDILERALPYWGVPPEGAFAMESPPGRERVEISDAERSLKSSGSFFEVPDFTGATMRHVLKALSPYPVEAQFSGRGVAVQQRPRAGEKIAKGSKVHVAFKPLY